MRDAQIQQHPPRLTVNTIQVKQVNELSDILSFDDGFFNSYRRLVGIFQMRQPAWPQSDLFKILNNINGNAYGADERMVHLKYTGLMVCRFSSGFLRGWRLTINCQTNFENFNWTSISAQEARALRDLFAQFQDRYYAVAVNILSLLKETASHEVSDMAVNAMFYTKLIGGLKSCVRALEDAIGHNQFGQGLVGFEDYYGP